MTESTSRAIYTNQTGPHERLHDVVTKHLTHAFKKPYAQHTLDAFNDVNAIVQQHQGPLILDACCGIGESTAQIAEQHPGALVIGVDKSEVRIQRHQSHFQADGKNYVLVRADLNDFFRLVVEHKWPVTKQYILYPNPWPKSKHIQRRWHGAAVFPSIIAIGGELELRSNWQLYLQEFQIALRIAGVTSQLNELAEQPPLTPFERKYRQSGQQCYQLRCQL